MLLATHAFVVPALRCLLNVLGEPEFFIAARLGNAELLVRELPSLEKR